MWCRKGGDTWRRHIGVVPPPSPPLAGAGCDRTLSRSGRHGTGAHGWVGMTRRKLLVARGGTLCKSSRAGILAILAFTRSASSKGVIVSSRTTKIFVA
ncbi:hypothetical protein Nepgr_033434 [Nepenthes gracilis]|uniref:Uncharacterized protein n=1 Tax=Nepenthes gracilis TaxID=150966 RepID=A0AAD3Y8D4_NEPGR|nr:hypothetical protein Nepgr_033434 [Nepenthes gracilis]